MKCVMQLNTKLSVFFNFFSSIMFNEINIIIKIKNSTSTLVDVLHR